ncbi:MAG TPA: NAD(P)H-hydrate epimerase [Pirellulaceae bacterium]
MRLHPPFPGALSTQQLQELDRRAVDEYGIPSIVLMENAGRGACDVLMQCGTPQRVLICCGRGNNAGDGLVLARHLELRGVPATVTCWQDPETWKGDTRVNYHIARAAGLDVRNLSDDIGHLALRSLGAKCDWIVDALLGTGAQGAPRPPLDQVIRAISSMVGPRILAIDLPSGLDVDSGVPFDPVVRAHLTVTLAAPKVGFANPTSWPYLGDVYLGDIGVPTSLVDTRFHSRDK